MCSSLRQPRREADAVAPELIQSVERQTKREVPLVFHFILRIKKSGDGLSDAKFNAKFISSLST